MVFVVSIITISMHGDINPEDAALALTYVLSMASIFQYTMRLTAEVEARFTSVERIHRQVVFCSKIIQFYSGYNNKQLCNKISCHG